MLGDVIVWGVLIYAGMVLWGRYGREVFDVFGGFGGR